MSAIFTELLGKDGKTVPLKCPVCNEKTAVAAEFLYRWWPAPEPTDKRTEPADFLTSDRMDGSERVDALFASWCPQCNNPINLRINGPRGRFAQVVSRRKGGPGIYESDLRALEMDLKEILPTPKPPPEEAEWCSILDGAVCQILGNLTPKEVDKRGPLSVIPECQLALERMMLKLEEEAARNCPPDWVESLRRQWLESGRWNDKKQRLGIRMERLRRAGFMSWRLLEWARSIPLQTLPMKPEEMTLERGREYAAFTRHFADNCFEQTFKIDYSAQTHKLELVPTGKTPKLVAPKAA